MRQIALFDTSIATDNLGDEIIMDAVADHLREMLPDGFTLRIPTHDTIGAGSRAIAQASDLSFVGGTNLLCANWFYKRQWKIGPLAFWRIGNPILMGVGWHFYQRTSDPLTKAFFRYLFGRSPYQHSVRDEYTRQRMLGAGVDNVVNTGCPTMWKLTPEHCAKIPTTKAKHVLTTVTAYRHDPKLDKQWIDVLCARYDTVYFWSQMYGDLEYMQAIAGDRVTIVEPSLTAYNDILAKTDSLDYIGTRLHGGVRALQHGRRSLIIEVDNRAAEIGKDTGLPTVKRDDVASIEAFIAGSEPLNIQMPWEAIAAWKAQFK